MISFVEVTRPVKPVYMDKNQEEYFNQSMVLFKSEKFARAATQFKSLSELFSSKSASSKASANAMLSNFYKARARIYGEMSIVTRSLLEKALEYLGYSLKSEPYWAEYLKSKGRLEVFIHQKYGCKASFDGKVWTTRCYKVSRKLGLPGVSPGMTVCLECSICGKDPVLCEHIPGRIYDGRVALQVARDIKFDHLAIVDEPMQLETYINPNPLTAEILRDILPSKLAEKVISGRKRLTCKHLLKAITKHRLRGINWQTQ